MTIATTGLREAADRLIAAEIAFILAEDLDGDLSESRRRGAAGVAVPAIEIVDSRVRDWSISIVDTIADNGSSALFAPGSGAAAASDLDFASRTMRLTQDGAVVSTGTGLGLSGQPAQRAAVARAYRPAQRLSGARRPHRALRCAGSHGAVRPGSKYVAEIDESVRSRSLSPR
jgi:2-keto-4-pentenoate hydratase